MNRAIMTTFHKYQPYGGKYYEPILDFFISNLEKVKDEFDVLYLLDSTWNIDKPLPEWVKVVNVNPHLRYYDAYKEVLPQVKEELVMFMDNDMVVYKKGIVGLFFGLTHLEAKLSKSIGNYGVVSIYDTIGTYKTEVLGGKNKFCPYLFSSSKDLLMNYIDIDWAPHMPHSETLGKLTEAIINDGVNAFEIEEDKSSIYFDGTKDGDKSKDLGYYHIRAGSTPAVLLAYREHDSEKYWEYINNQPKNEYLRQFAWYWIAGGEEFITPEVLKEMEVGYHNWLIYIEKFRKYHGL